jgi:signal transduction histidine kinase
MMPAEIEELSALHDAMRDRTFTEMRRGSSPHLHEVEAERLYQRIDALEREKASLEACSAVAAHEMLQPLILAEAYVSLVGERLAGGEHADARRDLDAVSRAARRGRMLVETLLLDARAIRSELRRGAVDLGEVVEDCLAMLRLDLEAGRIEVQVEPLPTVEGDEALIAAVYKNLLLNAIKYAPRCESSILVGSEAVDAGDPAVRLFVQSDGPQIPADERERIFEPFFRGQGERRARGTGLGLTVCRSIVERHGGTIRVTAGVPSGNRFCFTLPG